MLIFSYPSVLTYVLGAQKNRLIEMVLLNTHHIYFGWEIRKLNFVTEECGNSKIFYLSREKLKAK